VETVWSAVDLGLAPELEQELVRSLAKALDTEESDIDVERPFGEMGLDSVIGVEWIRSLNKQYASNLNASIVYDYPNIRQLAGFLQKVVLKQQQTSVSSTSALSLDDILQKIQQRELPPEEAISILSYILPSKQKSEI
jgi:acyl carrier protein